MVGPRTKQKSGSGQSALATKIIQRWADAGGDVPLDRLSSELGDVQRYDLVAALKELERAGAGEFLVGRAGRKARFIWRTDPLPPIQPPTRKGRVAPGQTPAPRSKHAPAPSAAVSGKEPAPPAVRTASGKRAVLEHAFHLRPDHIVKVQLPADVDSIEVERFCQFLRAIPFDRASER